MKIEKINDVPFWVNQIRTLMFDNSKTKTENISGLMAITSLSSCNILTNILMTVKYLKNSARKYCEVKVQQIKAAFLFYILRLYKSIANITWKMADLNIDLKSFQSAFNIRRKLKTENITFTEHRILILLTNNIQIMRIYR